VQLIRNTVSDSKFKFTFDNIAEQYRVALEKGYEFCTCEEYVQRKREGRIHKLIVNRVDIDFSVKRAERLGNLFNQLGIKASFFIRLHASEYNPFSFENYRIIKGLIHAGHEIGYHSEVVDQSEIWGEDAEKCFLRDISVINHMFGIEISGTASHGGLTGANNLDFWKERTASDYGLLYEAYDKESAFNLFDTSFYVSDSEWTQWKCYDRGTLLEGNRKTLTEHLEDSHDLIYLLIHSDTYFDKHFYE